MRTPLLLFLLVAIFFTVFNSWDFCSGLELNPSMEIKMYKSRKVLPVQWGRNVSITCTDDTDDVNWEIPFIEINNTTVISNAKGNKTVYITKIVEEQCGTYKCQLEKSNKTAEIFIVVKGKSHCADVNPPLNTDTPALKNARLEIYKTLNSWLNQNSTSNNSTN